MKIFTAHDVHARLQWPDLLHRLQQAYAGDFTMPQRQIYRLDQDATSNDAFALLPSWNDEVIAVKAFTYFPSNPPPYPSLHSQILLFHRQHGHPLALIDGSSVTYWRTAGISALASKLLSRSNASTLLIIGTGNLAPYLIRAHASVRDFSRVLIWGRQQEKAQRLASACSEEFPHITCEAVHSLEHACAAADVIVCATGSSEILIRGAWIREGTHVDLLGNHHAHHRECDTELVLCSRVYVDTYLNCLKEAGEILIPMAEGVFQQDQIYGELASMCSGQAALRESDADITLFKSVGAALGDLATALAVFRLTDFAHNDG